MKMLRLPWSLLVVLCGMVALAPDIALGDDAEFPGFKLTCKKSSSLPGQAFADYLVEAYPFFPWDEQQWEEIENEMDRIASMLEDAQGGRAMKATVVVAQCRSRQPFPFSGAKVRFELYVDVKRGRLRAEKLETVSGPKNRGILMDRAIDRQRLRKSD